MGVVDAFALRTLLNAYLHCRVASRGERAACRHIQQVDGCAGYRLQLGARRVGSRYRAKQTLGVFVAGVVEYLVRSALLADGACIHYYYLVAELSYNAEVVGYHDYRHAQLLLERGHKLEYLSLNGNVECRGGFVGDEDIRFAGERHCYHNSLTHTAGEFKRILLHALLGLVDVNEAKHLDRPVIGFLLVAVGVQGDGLHELVAYGVGGVQRSHRVLEDYRDLVASDILHDLFACADELLPVELYRPADYLAGRGEYLHYRVCGDGFARAGFADYAEHFAALKRERNAVDRFNLARVGEKRGMKIIYFQQSHNSYSPFSAVELRVKGVTQTVAEEVQREDDERNDHCGDNEAVGVGADAVERVGGKRAERRHRGVNAETEERKIALGEYCVRDLERGRDYDDADAVRHKVLSDYPAALCAGRLCGEDVFLLAQREDLTSDKTGHRDPIEQTEYDEKADDVAAYLGEHRALYRGLERILEHRREQYDHEHIGQGIDDIDYTHYHHIHLAAHIARDRAYRHTDDKNDYAGEEADRKGDSRAVDYTDEIISAGGVRAENVGEHLFACVDLGLLGAAVFKRSKVVVGRINGGAGADAELLIV